MKIEQYRKFLERKKQTIQDSGFRVEEKDLNPILFPFQKYCVTKALKKGRYALFEDAGFIYHSRVTIWKNPVTEMQRTKALGLLHKQLKKDSAMSRVGIPDYLMVFRKEGEHHHPVHCNIDVDTWQKWASPVWMDIDYSNTLNKMNARGEKDEKHICPLQLDTIKRAVCLWSNEGDVVLTPFMGIGSEVYQSILCGRKGIGFELKESYFKEAIKNVRAAEQEKAVTTLF